MGKKNQELVGVIYGVSNIDENFIGYYEGDVVTILDRMQKVRGMMFEDISDEIERYCRA